MSRNVASSRISRSGGFTHIEILVAMLVIGLVTPVMIGSLIGSLRQVWMYITQRPDEVETHAEVSSTTCLNCHRLQEETAQADLRHVIGQKTDCLLCHGQELHRVQPSWSDICASCH